MSHARNLVSGSIVLAALLAFAGCGSSIRHTARGAISAGGRAIVAVDDQNSAAMAATREGHIASSGSAEEFRLKRQPYWDLEASLRAATALLQVAEQTLEIHGEDGLKKIAGCTVAALVQLETSIHAFNDATGASIVVPAAIHELISVLDAYGSECHAD